MEQNNNKLDFDVVCQYIGQLFLETRHEIVRLSTEIRKMQVERDQALSLISKKKEQRIDG